MKLVRHYFLCSLVVLSLSACQHSDTQINYAFQKGAAASLQIFDQPEQTIAIIYDYDPIRAKLESRAVKVQPGTGDDLRDALQAFFATSRINGDYAHLQLKEVDNSEKPFTFVFSGQPQHESEKDKMLFDMALEMTIARNSKSMDNTIIFE